MSSVLFSCILYVKIIWTLISAFLPNCRDGKLLHVKKKLSPNYCTPESGAFSKTHWTAKDSGEKKKKEILEPQILGHPFLQGFECVGSISVGKEERRYMLHMTGMKVIFMNREFYTKNHVGNIPIVHPST